MSLKEFKQELIEAYDKHVIDCMNENGILKIEEYIESFINWIDFNLRYNTENLEDMKKLFKTSKIEVITKKIEKILSKYEYQ